MVSEVEKMAVAECCDKYSLKSMNVLSGFGSMCKSCSSCSNYIRGHCAVNAYENTLSIIKTN